MTSAIDARPTRTASSWIVATAVVAGEQCYLVGFECRLSLHPRSFDGIVAPVCVIGVADSSSYARARCGRGQDDARASAGMSCCSNSTKAGRAVPIVSTRIAHDPLFRRTVHCSTRVEPSPSATPLRRTDSRRHASPCAAASRQQPWKDSRRRRAPLWCRRLPNGRRRSRRAGRCRCRAERTRAESATAAPGLPAPRLSLEWPAADPVRRSPDQQNARDRLEPSVQALPDRGQVARAGKRNEPRGVVVEIPCEVCGHGHRVTPLTSPAGESPPDGDPLLPTATVRSAHL